MTLITVLANKNEVCDFTAVKVRKFSYNVSKLKAYDKSL